MRPRDVAAGVQMFAVRTPTLPPATHTNSYAIGSTDVLLVEPSTPYDDERRAWIAWARAMPSRGSTPVALVITHHHEDHTGGAAFLSRELGLPLWAHEETRNRLPGDVRVTRIVREGETLLDAWRVLHTPGHAPGHICLHDESAKTLICGDMVASVGTILIAPGDGDMRTYLNQLARLEGLGADVALPAHGEPIASPARVFRQTIDHRLMREAKVLAALGPTPSALADILPKAYGDTPMHVWPIAALSLQAHLDKLAAEGRVTRTGDVYRLTT